MSDKDSSKVYANSLIINNEKFSEAHFKENFWWTFANFKESDDLPLNIYRTTFTNTKLKGKWLDILHPVEYLFYHKFYKKLSKKGNCFGMCLEALYIKENKSVFIAPLKKNSDEVIDSVNKLPDELLREIKIKQGYQGGLNCIKWFIQLTKKGVLSHPSYLISEVSHYINTKNYPIISLMNGLGDAHAVLAYRIDEMVSEGKCRIYVADPNFAYIKGENPDEQYLEIDREKETFIYWDGKKIVYQTDKRRIFIGINIPRGCVFAIPYSLLSSKSKVPNFISLLSLSWKAFSAFIRF